MLTSEQIVNCFFFDEADFERSCKSKKHYSSAWQAKFAADEQEKLHSVKLSWYKCKYCGQWHLTSRQ